MFLWRYFPASGYRHYVSGLLFTVGAEALCRSSSSFGIGGTKGSTLDMLSNSVSICALSHRANSSPVRCVQELTLACYIAEKSIVL